MKAAFALMLMLAAGPVAATPAPVAPFAPTLPAPVTPAATLSLIDMAIAEQRYPAAGDLIARTQRTADSPALQLRTAELLLASGDIAGAATAFTQLSDLPGIAPYAFQGLGLARLRQSDLAAATVAIDAALARDPGLSRAWNARGVVADRRRDWVAADNAYARAIAIDPRSAAVLTNRGYSLLLRGRYAEGETDLAQAVAIDPALATARTNLRFARAMQGKYQQAFAGSTRRGLAADLNTVGFAAMSRGDAATAETYFNRALALNTRFDRTAWANLTYLKQRSRPASGAATDPNGDGDLPVPQRKP